MKKTLALALTLSLGCAGLKQIDTGHAYSDAERFPQVYSMAIVDINNNNNFMQGRDLNSDGLADVLLVYRELRDGTRSSKAFEYIWVDFFEKTDLERGAYREYARQGDIDIDGKIDYVSGDVKKMNKWLDKLEEMKK